MEDIPEIKHNKFLFTKLNKMKSLEKNAPIDVIAIIKDPGTTTEFVPKNKTDKSLRRVLKIYDDS